MLLDKVWHTLTIISQVYSIVKLRVRDPHNSSTEAIRINSANRYKCSKTMVADWRNSHLAGRPTSRINSLSFRLFEERYLRRWPFLFF